MNMVTGQGQNDQEEGMNRETDHVGRDLQVQAASLVIL